MVRRLEQINGLEEDRRQICWKENFEKMRWQGRLGDSWHSQESRGRGLRKLDPAGVGTGNLLMLMLMILMGLSAEWTCVGGSVPFMLDVMMDCYSHQREHITQRRVSPGTKKAEKEWQDQKLCRFAHHEDH